MRKGDGMKMSRCTGESEDDLTNLENKSGLTRFKRGEDERKIARRDLKDKEENLEKMKNDLLIT